ncbi:MAG: class I SAM-dependent methyltransferase [Rhodospirillaceae bacterium]|nr:class I SAM-dependent methyltransferase [Rhodospirillaceae bacterium]
MAEIEAAARHRIFFLRVRRRIYVGQKPVDLPIESFGIVDPSMLLGELHTVRGEESCIKIQLMPLSTTERNVAFEAALAFETSELEFPFALLGPDRRELVSPPEFWTQGSDLAELLDAGERHLRDFTRQIIPTLKLSRNAIVFDPACSTGTFLVSIGEAFPEFQLYGADISPRMVELARTRLQQVEVATIGQFSSTIAGSELLVLRFLNAEVMRSEEAASYFAGFADRLPSKSYMLIMGYTPIAISIPYLASQHGLSVIRSIGGWQGMIFQFYVLRKR